MRILFLLIIFISNNVWANLSLTGSSIYGEMTLSGFLKNLIYKDAIPYGGLVSYHGYESVNFTPMYNKNTKAQYCISGLTSTANNSILGLSFGGTVTSFNTFDQCLEPKDYTGGFFNINLSYNFGKENSSKAMNGSVGLHLSFDLQAFSEKLISSYSTYSQSKLGFRKKLLNVVVHLSKYSLTKSAKNILATDLVLFKLFMIPFVPMMAEASLLKIEQLISRSDTDFLNTFTQKTRSTTLRDRLVSSIYNMKRDPELYKCTGKNCEETLVDMLYFLEAIEENMGDCHSISTEFSLESAWDIKLPFLNSPWSYSYGYSFYGLNGVKETVLPTGILATKQFVAHNFAKRAQVCESVTENAAHGFTAFLKLFSTK